MSYWVIFVTLKVVMLSVVMLSVVMLSVVMLIVGNAKCHYTESHNIECRFY